MMTQTPPTAVQAFVAESPGASAAAIASRLARGVSLSTATDADASTGPPLPETWPPQALASTLHTARVRENKMLACAKSGDWRHPVVGLWPVSLRADLRHALVSEGLHKIEVWTGRHGVAIAEWPDTPVDPFLNVNTPEDRDRANALAKQYPDI